MSHLALRRLMVRLLHDPGLADRVAAGDPSAFEGSPLEPHERAWVRAVPRAAWRTDPDRPRRVMTALRDEYHETLAIDPGVAATFFASTAFHRAVQDRGSLAVAFGDHAIAAGTSAAARETALRERAVAIVRRAPRLASPSGPDLRRLPAHVILLDEATPALLVVRTSSGDVTIEEVADGLVGVFREARNAAPRATLEALLVEEGATPGEAAGILDDLVRDGLLV